MNEQTDRFMKLIKLATIGLIGDNIRVMELEKLYHRVQDQADKLGVFGPSWAALCDTLEQMPEYDYGEGPNGVSYLVYLPKLKGSFKGK